ncbi:hypothetical protein CYMTET_29193 [Cymbomonas tetramitiformis]|uniref:Uncharacterized protein n=1 Tax=Cymbomonas tetramitiformis TaxID=36881 RepID=A0AAE0FLJ0_9CHLO|nr:hypothetical protein CYMTET_29193 [Cymbomonas tetramitiformis]
MKQESSLFEQKIKFHKIEKNGPQTRGDLWRFDANIWLIRAPLYLNVMVLPNYKRVLSQGEAIDALTDCQGMSAIFGGFAPSEIVTLSQELRMLRLDVRPSESIPPSYRCALTT